jgi:hypothetical protein
MIENHAKDIVSSTEMSHTYPIITYKIFIQGEDICNLELSKVHSF